MSHGKKPVYITTAIPYANARPHVGFAMEAVQADALARLFKQDGHTVRFQSGTDVHGQKMERTAAEAGVSAQEFSQTMTEEFRNLASILNLSWDEFVATFEPRHHAAAQAMWKLCEKDIYKKEYEAFYCVGCERFLTDKEIVDGKCPIHNKAPELVKEENYFFKLSAYTEQVKALISQKKLNIQPEGRANEMLGLLNEGLEDISISRPKEKLAWGIPVPGDESHVMYVWFDALTNYLTGLGFPDTTSELYKTYWEQGRVIHIIGKDILRQHAALWIGMLLSAGLPTPSDIFVHGFITVDGQKMSKSIGNVLEPAPLVEKYGVDAVRYYLLRDIPSNNDGDFSITRLEERYRSELANNIGNFVSRVAAMAGKYNIVATPDSAQSIGVVSSVLHQHVNENALHRALALVVEYGTRANVAVDTAAPWALAKQNDPKLSTVMQELINYGQNIAHLIEPFMPSTAAQIQVAFGTQPIQSISPLFPPLPKE